MKLITRDFTRKEKILLLLLSLILVALCYYQFVDKPVRAALEAARTEASELEVELSAVETKLARMRKMRAEMEDITAGGTISEMASYNNSKAEIALLNDILADTYDYTISFANVTRSGDQIRRNFTLTFNTDSYTTMSRILTRLSSSHYRCLIGDIRCSSDHDVYYMNGYISVSITATFYETMVGGTPDAGLPS